MHTYKKERDGTYAVGQWLTSALEYKFMTLFYVADRQSAVAAICALNGADMSKTPIYPDFRVLTEYEPPPRAKYWLWTLAIVVVIVAAITAISFAHAEPQRTIYDREGNVVGRYTTDTQGTTTLYGRDGRVIGRESGATIMMDGVSGSIFGDRRGPSIPGQIKKDKR